MVKHNKRRKYNQTQYKKRIEQEKNEPVLASDIIKKRIKQRSDRLQHRRKLLENAENVLKRYRKICNEFETRFEGAVNIFLQKGNRNIDLLLVEFQNSPQTSKDFELLEFADLMFEYLLININHLIFHRIGSFVCFTIIVKNKAERIPFARSSTWGYSWDNYYQHFYETAFLIEVENVIHEESVLSYGTYNNYKAGCPYETREVKVKCVLKGLKLYHNAEVQVYLTSASLIARVMTECGIDINSFKSIQTTAHVKKERGLRDLRHFLQLNGYGEKTIPLLVESLRERNTRLIIEK